MPEDTLWCYACNIEVVKDKANMLAHVKDRKHKENVAFASYGPEFFVENKLAIADGTDPSMPEGTLLCQAFGVEVVKTKDAIRAHVDSGQHRAFAWCVDSGFGHDFSAKNKLITVNDGNPSESKGALWCEFCGVKVEKTKAEVLCCGTPRMT